MQLKPSPTGWVAHPRPFDFELGPGALREEAFRFLNATPHIPAFYAARPRLEIIRQVGVERIRQRPLELTRRLIERARE